jgi:hypothetical protein
MITKNSMKMMTKIINEMITAKNIKNKKVVI